MDSQRHLGPTVLCAGLALPAVTWIGGRVFDELLHAFGTYRDLYLISPLFFVLSIFVGFPMAVSGCIMTMTRPSEHPQQNES